MSIAEVTAGDVAPTGWDLTELLPDAEEETFRERLADLEAAVDLFEGARRELATLGSPRLLELVGEYESIVSRMHLVAAYGSLWFASDTQSEAPLAPLRSARGGRGVPGASDGSDGQCYLRCDWRADELAADDSRGCRRGDERAWQVTVFIRIIRSAM